MKVLLVQLCLRRPYWLATFVATWLGLSGVALGDTKDLCVTQIGGLAGPPLMDGRPEGDVGWNSAVQVGLREGKGVPRMGTLQLGRHEVSAADKSLYLSVDLTGFQQSSGGTRGPGLNDTVVIALSTDADAAHDWRIHISPFSSPILDPLLSQSPRAKKVWRDSTKWNLAHPASPAACAASEIGKYATCSRDLTIGDVKIARRGSRWSLEIKLPYHSDVLQAGSDGAVYIPTSGEFRLYANVVSANDVSGVYVEDPWPTDATLVPRGEEYIENSTPDKGSGGAAGSWGVVSFNDRAACTGVRILSAGVRGTNAVGTPLGSASRPTPPSGTDAAGIYYTVGSTKARSAAECGPLADSFDWSGTQANPTGTRGPSNWFVAHAENTSSVGVAGIGAKFQIAPWGLPSAVGTDWDLIGKRFDPDAPGGNDIFQSPSSVIGPIVTDERQTNWQLSYKESCMYVLSNRTTVGGSPAGHHCVQAELTSTDPDAVFLQKSLQFNHDVVAASTVSRTATISGRGYGVPPNRRAKHDILLQLDSVVRTYRRDNDYYYASSRPVPVGESDRSGNSEVSPQFRHFSKIHVSNFPNGLTEAMTWIARGYLKSGGRLGIGDKRYEKAKFIGGFSMEAGHAGPVDAWTVAFSATDNEAIEPVGGDYAVHVRQDDVVQVTTTVEVREKGGVNGKYALWLALGRTSPQSSFSNNYDGGLSATVGLEYNLTPSYALEATLSGYRFRGSSGAVDIDVTQIGVNATWYFTPQPLRWFAAAGVGSYKFDPGRNRTGVSLSAGFQYELAPQWSLEARYGLHSVSGNAPNSRFSTLQLGVRYAF